MKTTENRKRKSGRKEDWWNKRTNAMNSGKLLLLSKLFTPKCKKRKVVKVDQNKTNLIVTKSFFLQHVFFCRWWLKKKEKLSPWFAPCSPIVFQRCHWKNYKVVFSSFLQKFVGERKISDVMVLECFFVKWKTEQVSFFF